MIAPTLILLTSFFAAFLTVRPFESITWETFVTKYNKTYSSPVEMSEHMDNFHTNIRLAEIYNKRSQHAVFGDSPFLDLSRKEFESKWLGKRFSGQALARSCLAGGVNAPRFSPDEVQAVPDTFDWRTKGVVTPVKNQQACGSCFAFSSTGNIESLWAIAGNKLITLSEQEIVDCSTACSNIPPYGNVCNQGCDGGFQWNAFFDIISWKGLETEAEYPYLGFPGGSCGRKSTGVFAPISNYTCLSTPAGPADEVQMQAYIYKNGPVSIALNAALLMTYSSGVIDPWFPNFYCDPDSLDHALLIVGWGNAENWVGETIPYWTVKNSWSAQWGENGYFRIARGVNLCGIAESVLSAVL